VAGGSRQRPRTTRKSFLDLLAPADREFLEANCRRQEFRKDDWLFRQGDPAGQLVVIQTGLVKVSSVNAAGTEAVLAIRGAGDVLGEMSSVDNGRRCATVTALNPVTALVVEPPVFAALLLRPSAARALLVVLVRRLREADRHRLQFGTKTTVIRRAAMLLHGLVEYGRESRDGRIELEMELSQQDLASAIGAHRSAVNRALAELGRRGILTTSRQRITILRPDELRRVGE
jgi:CRP/FNR family cyclic AMP-dependent transcriptional regulator